DRCGHCHHHPQDPRRRYRCRLRSARRRGAGSYAGARAHAENGGIPEKIRQGFRPDRRGAQVKKKRFPSAAVFTAVAVLLLAGCASNPEATIRNDLPTSSDQTDSQKRARIRLQLAVGYYEQRQMPVALDEIKQALLADPNFAEAYSMRGLIYM